MSTWRERGYVQDSDEDETINDIETQNAHDESVDGNAAHSNVGQNLQNDNNEAQEESGRYLTFSHVQIHDDWDELDGDNLILAAEKKQNPHHQQEEDTKTKIDGVPSSSGKEHAEIFSISSSPLSSISSISWSQAQPPIRISSAITADQVPPVETRRNSENISFTEQLDLDLDRLAQIEGRRSFRKRNPIQLHPYLVENEQYRQSLRARGLRPVTVRNQESQAPHSQDYGIGATNDLADNDGSLSPFAGSSSSEDPSSPLLQQQRSPQPLRLDGPANNYGKTVPRSVAKGTPYSSKRRKISHIPSLNLEDTDPYKLVYEDGSESRRIFDLPQSARLSRSPPLTRKRPRLKKFKVPREISPKPLPTPLASSDGPRHALNQITFDSESDNNSDSPVRVLRRQKAQTTIHEPGARIEERFRGSDSDSTDVELKQIKKARRKIRGVLPASWIRLDKHAQAQKEVVPARERLKAMHEEHAIQENPARNATLSNTESKVLERTVVEISDQSDVEPGTDLDFHDLPSYNHPETSAAVQRSANRLQDSFGEATEGDWINPMKPSTKGHQDRSIWRKKKRQLRLTDNFTTVGRKTTLETSVVPRNKPSGLSAKDSNLSVQKSKPEKRRTESKPPETGIIDAVASANRKSLPDFVRVAVRQAHKRPKKARHSPSKKLFSLSKAQDSLEVQEVFRAWENGSIQRNPDLAEPAVEPPAESFRASDHADSQHSGSNTELFSPGTHEPSLKSGKRTVNNPEMSRQLPKPKQTRIPAKNSARTTTENPIKFAKPISAPRPSKHDQRNLFNRPGQFEVLQVAEDEEHHEAAFQRDLLNVNERYHMQGHFNSRPLNPMIGRFLEGDDTAGLSNRKEEKRREIQSLTTLKEVSNNSQRQPRKRKPNKLDLNSAGFAHREPLATEATKSTLESPIELNQDSPFEGLGLYGTAYSVDFGIHHLPLGTYLNQTTFVGSGRLDAILKLRTRDLDEAAPSTIFAFQRSTYNWRSWNDTVSTQLGEIFGYVEGTIELCQNQSNTSRDELASRITIALDGLKSVIDYYSKSLSFSDPVDRKLCVSRSHEALNGLLHSLSSIAKRLSENVSLKTSIEAFITRCSVYIMAFTEQLRYISNHCLVDQDAKNKINFQHQRALRFVAGIISENIVRATQSMISRCEIDGSRDLGSMPEDSIIEAVVLLHGILQRGDNPNFGFNRFMDDSLRKSDNVIGANVIKLEQIWKKILGLLPCLELDSTGVLKAGKRFRISTETCGIVKDILDRTFSIYSLVSNRTSTINEYIRTLFCRCHHLIVHWGWTHIESIMGCIFDFFARRGLALLRYENSAGSPKFLQVLDSQQTPNPDLNEPSFHIFLKILYVGLKKLQGVYSDKKIRNIAWRFIPNHGRVHKKEDDLRQDDLNSLRNHHDLLCVLYATSSPMFRPNIDLIQNLVDFNSSHSEVCRLNVRSWANLARYQLATDDSASVCERFAQWFNKMLRDSRAQHRVARTEAEAHFEEANQNDSDIMSREFLETAISSNQRQVEAVMSTALASLANVVQNAKNYQSILVLMQNVDLACPFSMFDSVHRRQNKVVLEALKVYQAFLERSTKSNQNGAAQDSSEDSQDYGDWPALDEDEVSTENNSSLVVIKVLEEPLHHLLSNAFGSEHFFDEPLLCTIVDIWVHILHLSVKSGEKGWHYYIDQHGPGSWHQLRDTDQTKKFSPYYFASIMERDPLAYEDNQQLFISAWMASIIARESMLKYQHKFTSALLNAKEMHPTLRNLPFTRRGDGRFNVRFDDFCQRRLNIISTVLANIRQSLEDAFISNDSYYSTLREEFKSLLKHLMNEMKKNFQEIQQGSTLRGSYVEFVQKVIEFMQQYTAEIVTIDRFFTDSAAFPLPIRDPTYVVGRLRAYGLKLNERRHQKSLVTFIQTASERAAVDSQQKYLEQQLKKSVADPSSREDVLQPSLRLFLLDTIFPAYYEAALTTDCGWILATPMFSAASSMFDELLFGLACSDAATTNTMLQVAARTMQTLEASLTPMLQNIGTLQHPDRAVTLRHIFSLLSSLLPPVDFLLRLRSEPHHLTALVAYFKALARALLTPSPHRHLPCGVSPEPRTTTASDEIKAFCARELRTSLSKHWSRHGEACFVLRGTTWREVAVEVGSQAEEESRLRSCVEGFLAVLERMPAFAEGVHRRREDVSFKDGALLLV